MAHPAPLTEQQLDEIETRAAHLHEYVTIADEPLQADADQLAGEDVPALIADLRRSRDRVADLEAYAYGCDAEGCVLPHSSWCDTAQKTAAANNGCTCGKPWTGHPQPHAMHCWTVNPPRAEVEEMRKRIAELTATPRRTLTPNEYDAAWHAVEGAAGEEGADPGTVLHAVLDRLGIEWQDAARPADAEDPAPAEDFTGTQPCGHDDYHSPHPWTDRPNTWCPGHSYDDDQAAAEEITR